MGGPMYMPQRPLSRLGFQEPKSNKLTTSTYPNLQGELKMMHQMQWQKHTKCSNPSLPNPTKATNAMEGYERKNKEEINKWTPRSRSKWFPHLEEKLIGGNVDLDLLSLCPQEDARIIGGIERKQAWEGQQWMGKLSRMVRDRLGKKGPLNRSSKIQPLCPEIIWARVSGAPRSFGGLKMNESDARPDMGWRLCVSARKLWPPKNWQQHQHKKW
jgi:hypothetical protein